MYSSGEREKTNAVNGFEFSGGTFSGQRSTEVCRRREDLKLRISSRKLLMLSEVSSLMLVSIFLFYGRDR